MQVFEKKDMYFLRLSRISIFIPLYLKQYENTPFSAEKILI